MRTEVNYDLQSEAILMNLAPLRDWMDNPESMALFQATKKFFVKDQESILSSLTQWVL